MTGTTRERPEVTVVLTTVDRPVLLRRAVACALEQVDVRVELLVVDDGGAGGAAHALADELATDPRLRIITTAGRTGVANARNVGIDEASAPHVAFFDDDDLWAPTKLREQLAAMQAQRTRWASTGLVVLRDDLTVRWITPQRERITEAAMREVNQAGTPSSLIAETALLRQIGGFDGGFSVLADWDVSLRLATTGGDGAGVAEALTGYVTHDGGMHRQSLRTIFVELRTMRAKHGPSTGGALTWRWISDVARDADRRTVAAGLALWGALTCRDARAVARAGRALIPVQHLRRADAAASPSWASRWTPAPAPAANGVSHILPPAPAPTPGEQAA